MGKIQMKGATAVGAEPVCRTCVHGLVLRGYRDSEIVVRCTFANPAFVVPFIVSECTEFYDRDRPSWSAMDKFAIHVSPKAEPKPVGFKVGFRLKQNADDADCDFNEDDASTENETARQD
jgi:hypothetical protein